MQFSVIRRQVGQLQLLALEPLAVGSAAGKLHLQFFVGNEAAGKEIHQEHFARLQAALVLDVCRFDRQHPDLGRHDDLVVVGQVVTRGAQAVAVEHRADVVAIGEHDGSGPVPGFHQRRVVFVEVALCLRHVDIRLPGLRNHHHDGFLQGPARHQQKLQHVVETARVGEVRLDDREQILDLVAEALARGDALAGAHPVLVAAQGVDFTVVAHEAIGLRPVPGGEGVGGEARVHHREMALVVLVLQVRVEGEKLPRGQHALVDEDARVQAAYVDQFLRVAGVGRPNEVFPRHVQRVIQLVVTGRAIADDGLFDERHRGQGGGPDIGLLRPDRHRAIADQGEPLSGQGGAEVLLERVSLIGIPRQEDVADRIGAGFRQGDADCSADLLHEPVRDGGHDAGAVAGIFLEAATAAVVHPGVDMVGVCQNLMARYALDVGHKTHTAGVFLKGRVVQAVLCGQPDFAVDSSILHAFNPFDGAITNRQLFRPNKNHHS